MKTRAEELRQALVRVLEAAGAAEAANLKNVASLKEERDKAAAEAAKAAAELLAPLLEELKTAAPALFAPAEDSSTQGDK
ncbi:MAG: hypothetical protein EXS02_15025 [Planctomycetes bacterium]|nr:hypothetical protein [Planctomycetota bacterium]